MMVFDIETRAKSLEWVKANGLMPSFKAPSNYKDPDKIAAKEAEHESDVMSRAALDPVLSEILAIGYIKDGQKVILSGDEAQMLKDFWWEVRKVVNSYGKLVGFNIIGFDLPFLIRRSWVHNVPYAESIRRGRYYSDNLVVDLAEIWRLGDKNTFISLDRISRLLGIGEKSGSGKDFAALWESDREAAIAYLHKDLELTEKLAYRLNAVSNDTTRAEDDIR